MTDAASSPASLWIGRILKWLVVVALLADAAAQFFVPEALKGGMSGVGMPMSLIPLLGVVMLSCAILYAIPQTTVFGAIVTTGFLGGAICTNIRVNPDVSPPVIICSVLGLMAWGGLYLMEPGLRALLPARR